MLILRIFLFVIPVLATLFGLHYFLYYSAIKIFLISNNIVKIYLAIGLGILTIGFIAVSILAHFMENAFTRVLYFLSSFWLGLFVNLILITLIAWIVVYFLRYAGVNYNSGFVGVIFILIALIYSIYGTYNAFNPRLKNIAVTIPNLPETWKNKKIIQLSDVHLGHIYRESFLNKVVDMVNLENPDMVVITGDLFDGMDGVLDEISLPLGNIKAKQGSYFITGNHETYLGVEKAKSALKKTGVKVLDDEVVDLNGLKLIGLSYPDRMEKINVDGKLGRLKDEYLGKPNILLYHEPTNINDFKNAGINLQLSGHTHRGQIFPFRYITSMIFKGYDYGLHVIGDYTLYTTNGTGTWGPPMRTGNTPEIVVITLK